MSLVWGCPRFWGVPGGFGVSFAPPQPGLCHCRPLAAPAGPALGVPGVSPGCPQCVPSPGPHPMVSDGIGMGLGTGTHSGLTPKPPWRPPAPRPLPGKRDGIITTAQKSLWAEIPESQGICEGKIHLSLPVDEEGKGSALPTTPKGAIPTHPSQDPRELQCSQAGEGGLYLWWHTVTARVAPTPAPPRCKPGGIHVKIEGIFTHSNL